MNTKKIKTTRAGNDSGAVLLTVIFVLIVIGLVGAAIYSLTFTSTYTQLNAQNALRAYYIAESGFRIVTAEYNAADAANKNTTLESLHGESLALPDNNGQIDLRIYPYWFYVHSAYTSGSNAISVKLPGGRPITDLTENPGTPVTIPGTGNKLKLAGKTRRATISSNGIAAGIITFNLQSTGFPYDIQPDEELFLVYIDAATASQTVAGEDGSLALPGTNHVARFIPAQNGSFRVHNEENDRMDYTYREKTSSGGTINLLGIRSQDPANPSVFPFSVDSASEIYFGKNLAVVAATTLGQGRFTGRKTIVEYSDVGLDGGFNIGRETISFEEDIEDFAYGLPMSGDPGNPADDPIAVDTVDKEIDLGRGLNNGYGAVWYGGDADTANCIDGRCNLGRGLRAYFEFESNLLDDDAGSIDYGDGFTFALISGVYDSGPGTYRNSKNDTGSGGEYLGYAGPGIPAAEGGDEQGIRPPKIALELDTYPNPGAGSICGGNSRVDHADATNNYPKGANHVALDYWGTGSATEIPGSLQTLSSTNFIADGGGFLQIQDDWSSAQGTISFWFKRNTIRSTDRFWGQNANMEMRFSGNDLVFDWGTQQALTISNHPFTQAGKWYFIAIAWDESKNPLNGPLNVYYATESTSILRIGNYPASALTVSTVGSTGNFLFNSSGGDFNQNYIVDGNASDLRYYNIERSQAEIGSDYNTRLSGAELNLQAYFPLQMDTADAGPAGIVASPVGTTGWSAAAPSVFVCSAIATRDDNRHGAGGGTEQPMNSLNTDSFSGDDGYYQVAKGIDLYNWLEDGRLYGVRLELIRPQVASGDGNFDYQIKAWVECVDATCMDLDAAQKAALKDTGATLSDLIVAPTMALTLVNGNPLELDPAVHADLKNILFGFTQGTGGARQDITVKNLEMRFIQTYPVDDLATW